MPATSITSPSEESMQDLARIALEQFEPVAIRFQGSEEETKKKAKQLQIQFSNMRNKARRRYFEIARSSGRDVDEMLFEGPYDGLSPCLAHDEEAKVWWVEIRRAINMFDGMVITDSKGNLIPEFTTEFRRKKFIVSFLYDNMGKFKGTDSPISAEDEAFYFQYDPEGAAEFFNEQGWTRK